MTPGTGPRTCREVVDVIADCVAGDLGVDERRVFEAHMADCRECAAYLRTYADTIRVARDAHAEAASPQNLPERFVRAIMEALERPPRTSRPNRGST
jgi:anti-sigma factor RsiW